MALSTDGGLYIRQEVTKYVREWYRTVYPDRWAARGVHHMAVGDLMLGEKRIVVPRIEAAGKASIYTGRAVDIPLLKLGATADEWTTRIVIMRAEWDYIADIASQEAANRSGFYPRRNIVRELMDGLKDKITERIHELVCFGDKAEGMDGLFQTDLIEPVQIPAGVNIHTLPAVEKYNLIRRYLKQFHKKSKLTAEAVKMLCTIDLYDALLEPFPQYNDTPLDRLIGRSPEHGRYVREIIPVNELSADLLEEYGVMDEGQGRERFVLCEDRKLPTEMKMQPSCIRQFYGLDYTNPRQATDTTWSMTAFEATSEVQYRQPFKHMFVDYDKFVEA